jgi:hypothetical protein
MEILPMNWLKNLVEHHKRIDEIASIFGVILYTNEHANIKRVLRNEDSWTAFDAVTGPHWVIFSIRPRQGQRTSVNAPPGTHAKMVPVWKEPEENKELLEVFEIESTEKLPLLLVFVEDENGEILKRSLKLKDTSIDDAYQSIKEALKLITKAVERVLPENRKIESRVFSAVHLAVSDYKDWEKFKKAIKFIKWAKKILPL